MTAIWSGPARRALAVILLLGLCGVLWGGVVVPLRDAAEAQRQEIGHSLRLLEGYRRAAAAAPELSAYLADLRAQADAPPGAVHGATSALAAAALQKAVKDIITRHGGSLQSAQALQAVEMDGLEAIDIRYALTLPPVQLPGLLHDLESHQPFLFLNAVDMRASEQGQEMATLSIRWTVRAFRRGGIP